MPPTVRGPARKNQIKTPPPAPVVVTPPPVPTTTTNNRRVRPVRKNTPAPTTTNNRRTTTVRTKPLAVTQSPQFRQKGIQRSTVSKPVVTPPTISLFKDGPVLKEVGFPSVPIVAPNVFLPPTIVPVRTPPPQPTIDTGINSNPLSTNTGGSINQPSIFPGYADTDSVVSGGIDNNTTMLIIAAIVCGFIILKKV